MTVAFCVSVDLSWRFALIAVEDLSCLWTSLLVTVWQKPPGEGTSSALTQGTRADVPWLRVNRHVRVSTAFVGLKIVGFLIYVGSSFCFTVFSFVLCGG